MSGTDVAVIAAGAAAIAAVNWWFFFAERRTAGTAAKVGATGVQQAVIRVENGYEPSRVRLRAGRPARLVFDRREDDACSEEVVLADLGIRRFLPAHQRTSVDLPPLAAGAHEFTCGMGMLRGTLLVEEA